MDTMPRGSRGRLAPRVVMAALLALGAAGAVRPAAADSSIGIGVHAWRTVDGFESDGFSGIRRDGLSYLLSYQYKPGALLKLEIDGEYFPNGFGGSTHYAVSPQAYVLLGSFIYGGVGIGTIFSKDFSNDFSSPYYAARVGVDMHLLPKLSLDVNANYHFNAFNELHGVTTGTVTLGATARFGL
jgi:hypothetical protein